MQPTTCVDHYDHPASALCKDDCLGDPMILKCTDDANLYCNQVNLESPLVYIGRGEDQWKPRKRRLQKSNGTVTVSGVVRGWFCGLSAVPTDILSIVTKTSKIGFVGAPTTQRIMASDALPGNQTPPESATGMASLGVGSIVLSVTKTQAVEVAPTDPGAVTDSIDLGKYPDGGVIQDEYDCDLDVDDDDCCFKDDDVTLEEPCVEECVEIAPRAKVPRKRQRRQSKSQAESTTEVQDTGDFGEDNDNVITNVVTITEGVRSIATAVPTMAPGMMITEAVLIASTTYASQSNHVPLSEMTQILTIVPPTGTSISSAVRPKTSGHPYGGVQKARKKDSNPNAGIIAGGVIGGLVVVAVLIWLLLWCLRRYRRDKQAKRIRKQRDSNPVSSRITTSWSF